MAFYVTNSVLTQRRFGKQGLCQTRKPYFFKLLKQFFRVKHQFMKGVPAAFARQFLPCSVVDTVCWNHLMWLKKDWIRSRRYENCA